MNKRKLQAMTSERAKDVKAPEYLGTLSAFLTNLTIEAALKALMDYPHQAIIAAVSPLRSSKVIMVNRNLNASWS